MSSNDSTGESCFVCGITFNGNPPKSAYKDEKLVQNFYQCLRLEPDVKRGLNALFCRQCKSGLELWDTVQQEISKWSSRADDIHGKFVVRVLRARNKKEGENKNDTNNRSSRCSPRKKTEKSPVRASKRKSTARGQETPVVRIQTLVFEEYGNVFEAELKKKDGTEEKRSGRKSSSSVQIKTEPDDDDDNDRIYKRIILGCPVYVECGVQTGWGKLKTKETQTDGVERRNRRLQTKITVAQETCGTQTKFKGTEVWTQTSIAQQSRGTQVRKGQQVNEVTQTDETKKSNRKLQTDIATTATGRTQTEVVTTAHNRTQTEETNRPETSCQTEAVGNTTQDAGNSNMSMSLYTGGVTPEVRNSNRRSLVKEVERGRFLFQDKIPFAFDNGTYKCGVCPDIISPNLMDITKHIRDTHREILSFPTVSSAPPPALMWKSRDDMENEGHAPRRSEREDVLPTGLVRVVPADLPLRTVPTLENPGQCVNLESVKPGSPERRANLVKYISRNKIPFDYMDGKFRCGLCPKQYSGNTALSKKYILRHVRKEHRESKVRMSPKRDSASSRPRPRQDAVKKVGEGKFLYRNSVPFTFREKRFRCEMCDTEDLIFWTKSGIIRHIKRNHQGSLPRKLCKRSNSSSYSTAANIRSFDVVRATAPSKLPNAIFMKAVDQIQDQIYIIPMTESAVCAPSQGFNSDSEETIDSDTEAVPSMIIDFPSDEGSTGNPTEITNTGITGVTKFEDDDEVMILDVETGKPVSSVEPANVPDDELSEPEAIEEEEEDTLVAVGPGKYKYGKCRVSLEFGKYFCRECFQAFVGAAGMEQLKNHIRDDHHELAPKTFKHVQETGPGNYIYREKVTFNQFGRDFRCGICEGVEEGKYRMLMHIHVVHRDKIFRKNETGLLNTEQTSPKEAVRGRNLAEIRGRGAIIDCSDKERLQDTATNNVVSAPAWLPPLDLNTTSGRKSQPEPRRRRRSLGEDGLVQQISLDEFLYCNTIPFISNGDSLKCGLCAFSMDEKQSTAQFYKHLRERHLGPEVLRKVGPKKYLYKDTLSFEWKKGRFLCEACSYGHCSIQRMLEHMCCLHPVFPAQEQVAMSDSRPNAVTRPVEELNPSSVLQVQLVTPEIVADAETASENVDDPLVEGLLSALNSEDVPHQALCSICGFVGSFFDFIQHRKVAHGSGSQSGTISNASPSISAARTFSVDQESISRPENAHSKDRRRVSMPELPKASAGGTRGTSSQAQSRPVPHNSAGLPVGKDREGPLTGDPLWSSGSNTTVGMVTSASSIEIPQAAVPGTTTNEVHVNSPGNNNKRYKCRMCSVELATFEEYGKHVRSHMGDRPFFCSGCPQRFQTYMEFNVHCELTKHNYAQSK